MEKAAENLPWVEKYRPNALQELISHEDIIGTIRKFIQEDKLPHLVTHINIGTFFQALVLGLSCLTS
jgi:replication factor C subunit 3/5